MDRPIDLTEWLPTATSPAVQRRDSAQDWSIIWGNLVTQTEHLCGSPYNANHWIVRALTLDKLGYPELAASDACKAQLICRSIFAKLDAPRYSLGSAMGFWMAHDDLQEPPRDLSASKQRLKEQLDRLNVLADDIVSRCESFHPQPYPWLFHRHRTRADAVLDAWNAEFRTQKGERSRPADCEIRRWAFGGHGSFAGGAEELGVFATRDIRADEVILRDRTRLQSGPFMQKADSLGIPSTEAHEIRVQAGSDAADLSLMFRCIQCCRVDGIKHPLDYQPIVRLRPHYRCDDRVSICRIELEIQNRVLQQFGIDIFADLNFDTWVLYTVRARLANNAWTGLRTAGLHSLFAAFNHSCEPNVGWQLGRDCVTLDVHTVQDISAGDQLFVAYDTWLVHDSLEDRRARLLQWLDRSCQCTRCVREEKFLAKSMDSQATLTRSMWSDAYPELPA